MPLTRGRWLSSAENGHRLVEAAFFSLEMLTTVGWTLWTASTTGVRREAAGTGRGASHPRIARPTIAGVRSRPRPRRTTGCGTAVILNFGMTAPRSPTGGDAARRPPRGADPRAPRAPQLP